MVDNRRILSPLSWILVVLFIEFFDPFTVSDLITAGVLAILVPIWAILLSRGVGEPDEGEPLPAAI